MELRAFTYLPHRYRHLRLKRLGHTSIKQIAELNWIFLTQKSKFKKIDAINFCSKNKSKIVIILCTDF